MVPYIQKLVMLMHEKGAKGWWRLRQKDDALPLTLAASQKLTNCGLRDGNDVALSAPM